MTFVRRHVLVSFFVLVSLAETGVLHNFDLASDGRRVLALLPAREDQQTENHATFVLNFFDEVRRRSASVVK